MDRRRLVLVFQQLKCFCKGLNENFRSCVRLSLFASTVHRLDCSSAFSMCTKRSSLLIGTEKISATLVVLVEEKWALIHKEKFEKLLKAAE